MRFILKVAKSKGLWDYKYIMMVLKKNPHTLIVTKCNGLNKTKVDINFMVQRWSQSQVLHYERGKDTYLSWRCREGSPTQSVPQFQLHFLELNWHNLLSIEVGIVDHHFISMGMSTMWGAVNNNEFAWGWCKWLIQAWSYLTKFLWDEGNLNYFR